MLVTTKNNMQISSHQQVYYICRYDHADAWFQKETKKLISDSTCSRHWSETEEYPSLGADQDVCIDNNKTSSAPWNVVKKHQHVLNTVHYMITNTEWLSIPETVATDLFDLNYELPGYHWQNDLTKLTLRSFFSVRILAQSRNINQYPKYEKIILIFMPMA